MPKKKSDESIFRKKLLEEIQGSTKGGLRRIVDNEVLLTPPVDVYETDRDFNLIFTAPGVGKDDMDIRIEDGVLIIEEKKGTAKKNREGNHIVKEVDRGRYFRKFHLTEDIDLSDLKGTIDKGILTIILKKKEVIDNQKPEAEETREETEKSKRTVKTLVQKPVIKEDDEEEEEEVSRTKSRVKKKR